jgi:hypothetical protein
VRRILTIALALVAVLGIASSASARSRDRNHDRLPDRWERAHHLSLKVKQARRDQDHDGLNNRGEFRARTNPRDADTDNDGIEDGDEHSLGDDPADKDSDNDGVEDGNEVGGKVESFDGKTLTIRRTDNSLVSGEVTDATEIECETAAQHEDDDNVTARASRDGEHSGSDDDGDNSGPGSGDDREGTTSGPGTVNESSGDNNDEGDDDHGDDDERACSKADLVAGTPVHEAELANGVFREVELVK